MAGRFPRDVDGSGHSESPVVLISPPPVAFLLSHLNRLLPNDILNHHTQKPALRPQLASRASAQCLCCPLIDDTVFP